MTTTATDDPGDDALEQAAHAAGPLHAPAARAPAVLGALAPTAIRLSRSGSTPSSALRTMRSTTRCSSHRTDQADEDDDESALGFPMRASRTVGGRPLLVQSYTAGRWTRPRHGLRQLGRRRPQGGQKGPEDHGATYDGPANGTGDILDP